MAVGRYRDRLVTWRTASVQSEHMERTRTHRSTRRAVVLLAAGILAVVAFSAVPLVALSGGTPRWYQVVALLWFLLLVAPAGTTYFLIGGGSTWKETATGRSARTNRRRCRRAVQRSATSIIAREGL